MLLRRTKKDTFIELEFNYYQFYKITGLYE